MSTAAAQIPQYIEALARGNEKRMARAEIKRSVEAGTTRVEQLILDPPECLQTTSNRTKRGVTLATILSWQRGWGRVKGERFCLLLEIPVTVEPHALSDARRARVVRGLDLIREAKGRRESWPTHIPRFATQDA